MKKEIKKINTPQVIRLNSEVAKIEIPLNTNVKSGGRYFWGFSNFYPYQLLELYKNSPTHNSVIDGKVSGIIGQGTTFENNDALEVYYDQKNQDFNTLVKRLAKDFALFNGFAIKIEWNNDGTYCHLSHLDMSGVRLSTTLDEYDCPTHVIFSKDWRNSYLKENRLKVYPIYNPELASVEPVQAFVYTEYTSGGNIYPDPDYVGGLIPIIMESRMAMFHLRQAENNYSPTLAIVAKEEPSPEALAEMKSQLDKNYKGTEHAGGVFMLIGSTPETAPEITPIKIDMNDGVYNELDSTNTQKILAAHRCPSPALVSIPGGAQLGGQSNELVQAQIMFDRTVLSPMRNIISDSINTILKNSKWNMGKMTIVPTNYNSENPSNTNNNTNQEVIQ